uniref:Uncharacterized protein n=1 Tax=Anopheles quadriannulatus TaxID=34691 RepID=A0A182XU27_ANOQN
MQKITPTLKQNNQNDTEKK